MKETFWTQLLFSSCPNLPNKCSTRSCLSCWCICLSRMLWREWICFQGEEKKTVMMKGEWLMFVMMIRMEGEWLCFANRSVRDDDKNGRRVACVLQTRVFVMMIRMEGECLWWWYVYKPYNAMLYIEQERRVKQSSTKLVTHTYKTQECKTQTDSRDRNIQNSWHTNIQHSWLQLAYKHTIWC